MFKFPIEFGWLAQLGEQFRFTPNRSGGSSPSPPTINKKRGHCPAFFMARFLLLVFFHNGFFYE